MAKAVRRQTAAQRIATLIGGGILVVLILFGIIVFVQGNQRTVTDSPMQRLISAPVAELFYVVDTGQLRDGVLYVTGHFAGVPDITPQDSEAWQEHTKKVAEIIAKELRGLASSVSLKQYYEGELVGEIVVPVK